MLSSIAVTAMLIMETGGKNRMVTNGNQYAGHDKLPSMSNEVIFQSGNSSTSSNDQFLLVYLQKIHLSSCEHLINSF